MNEFYVGYLPKAPVGIARRIRAVVVLLFIFAAIAAIVFVRVQRTFAPSVFEYGKVATFEGTIETNPYPILIVTGPGSPEPKVLRYLLVAEGKHGADSQGAAFAGKTVQLRGRKIYRDNQAMIEVVTGSISVMGDSKQPRQASKELGNFELTGEIVDSKCYLGVMNPGNGKVHRDCAVRCLSGGIPPVFATNDFDGRPAILILTDHSKAPLPKEAFLGRVAQPVRIRGGVIQTGDTLFLETKPSAISLLPQAGLP
jgi:hypothetical protein